MFVSLNTTLKREREGTGFVLKICILKMTVLYISNGNARDSGIRGPVCDRIIFTETKQNVILIKHSQVYFIDGEQVINLFK